MEREKRRGPERERSEASRRGRGICVFKDKALLAKKDIKEIENWQWFGPNAIKIDTFH